MMLYSTVASIVVNVSSLEEFIPFIKDLGLDLTREKHGDGPVHYSYNCGNCVLEFYNDKNLHLEDFNVKLLLNVPSFRVAKDLCNRHGSVVRYYEMVSDKLRIECLCGVIILLTEVP